MGGRLLLVGRIIVVAVAAVCAVLSGWFQLYRLGWLPEATVDQSPISLYIDVPQGSFRGAHFGAPEIVVSGTSDHVEVTVVATVDLPRHSFDAARDKMNLHVVGAPTAYYQVRTQDAVVENPNILYASMDSRKIEDSRNLRPTIPFGDKVAIAESMDGTHMIEMQGRGFTPTEYTKIVLSPELQSLKEKLGRRFHVENRIRGNVLYMAIAKLEFDYPVVAKPALDQLVGRVTWDPSLGSTFPMSVQNDTPEVGLHFCGCVAEEVTSYGDAKPASVDQTTLILEDYTESGSADFSTPLKVRRGVFLGAQYLFATFVVVGMIALFGGIFRRSGVQVGGDASRVSSGGVKKK